jgi:oxygen-independent coproporphyrinogen-3 oxidase
VNDQTFRERFGEGLREVFPKEIRKLEGLGLLEWQGDILRLTRKARLLGNVVFREFV